MDPNTDMVSTMVNLNNMSKKFLVSISIIIFVIITFALLYQFTPQCFLFNVISNLLNSLGINFPICAGGVMPQPSY